MEREMKQRPDSAPPMVQPRRKVRAGSIQAKLRVGAASDPAEAEADRFADAVTEALRHRPASGPSTFGIAGPTRIVRRTSPVPVMEADGGELPDHAARTIRASHGSPLEATVRSKMEYATGLDLTAVRIHRESPVASKIQASAFTLGSDVHFAAGQYRPNSTSGQWLLGHELAHVAQQAGGGSAGRLRPSDAVQRDSSGSVRRSILKFKVKDKEKYDPPATDVINELTGDHSDDFTNSDASITKHVKERLNNPIVGAIDVPTSLEVKMDNNPRNDSPSRSNRQQTIGQIGVDEFFIRTGRVEVFEGGHLIGHQFFDKNDKAADMAGSYLNLVPMSRTMNVSALEGWGKKEKIIADKVADLTQRKYLEKFVITIDMDRATSYTITLGELANRFGLTLDKKADPGETVKLYNWVPKSISAAYNNLDTMSEDEWSDAEENQLRNFHAPPISTRAELIAELQSTPLWARLTPAMQKKLTKL
jgi:Domain of unknown function (DUF4157)